jgi:hypothetical protein
MYPRQIKCGYGLVATNNVRSMKADPYRSNYMTYLLFDGRVVVQRWCKFSNGAPPENRPVVDSVSLECYTYRRSLASSRQRGHQHGSLRAGRRLKLAKHA